MGHLAYRNLVQNRVRLVLSVAGVALALTLVLAFDAIFTGVESQITAYIDRAGADVFVSQAGVRNLHMASSALPTAVVDRVRAVPGVAATTPILYTTAMLTLGEDRAITYVMGLPPGATMGGPWRVVQGAARPAAGEVILDRGVAAQAGVRLGDRVSILGQPFTVAGLSAETANLMNSVTFITSDDFARLRATPQVVSFVLVQVAPGVAPDAVARRIEAEVSGVTAQTRQAFAAQERKIVTDMSVELITIMNLVGLVIGLAVLALTIYTATLARRAEYGILKALGVRDSQLARVVVLQACYSVAFGFTVGLLVTLLVAALAPRLSPNLALTLSAGSLAKVSLFALASAALAALLPIRQIARLDPALVFKGGRAQ